MTRKKVKLAYITNDSARKATFKKRKKGLMKKVSELSTLCDIQACAVIYSPYDSQPEIWPSPSGVQQVLSRFKKMPEMEQSKKMVNQESFLRQRIGKASEQLKKQRRDNREKEVTQVMYQSLTGKISLHNLTMLDLNDLGWLIDLQLKEINKRVEELGKDIHQVQVAASSSSSSGPAGKEVHGVGTAERPSSGLEVNIDNMQRQQWFMELMNPVPAAAQEQQMGFGGEDMMMLPPFGDTNHINNAALWSNPFFP